MKKILFITVGLISFASSFAYMRPGYGMYYGPQVREERAYNAAYVPPDREFINQRYGEDIDNRESYFQENDDGDKLFWSYSQP